MDPKNIRLYGGNGVYFIEDQYQKDIKSYCKENNSCCKDTIFGCKDNNCDCKDTIFGCKDTIFDYEDACYYDLDANRILLYKKCDNEYFIG